MQQFKITIINSHKPHEVLDSYIREYDTLGLEGSELLNMIALRINKDTNFKDYIQVEKVVDA